MVTERSLLTARLGSGDLYRNLVSEIVGVASALEDKAPTLTALVWDHNSDGAVPIPSDDSGGRGAIRSVDFVGIANLCVPSDAVTGSRVGLRQGCRDAG
jgi:hypothetical protein